MVVSQVNVTLKSMEENTNKPQIQSEKLVDVGNLVYSYDLPSDKKNSLRPKKDSSEENDDENDDNNDVDAENDEEENSTQKRDQNGSSNKKKHAQKNRTRRSLDNDISKNSDNENDNDNENEDDEDNEQNNSSNKNRKNRKQSRNGDESDESSEYNREYHQPKPTLKDAPENPLLNYFIGNNGKSIQSRNEFNAKAEVEKLTEEIAEDLENPEEVPAKNTLRKFNVLAKVISTMNAKQIEETTRAMENKENKSSEKSRKVYRDALSAAGTGPSVNELMNMMEERKLKGEEAAEVILSLPTTIREPTEEMQRRFFVSHFIH